jgi:hypothetical protein
MCVVTNFTSDCRGFACAVSGSAMGSSNISTPQAAVAGSREQVVSGVEKSRREALWRGGPWATPPQLALCRVLRRMRVGFLVGGEGLDLGFGFSESMEPFLLVHGDATLPGFELTEQQTCSRPLGAQTPDTRV